MGKVNWRFPPEKPTEDGGYLVTIYTTTGKRRDHGGCPIYFHCPRSYTTIAYVVGGQWDTEREADIVAWTKIKNVPEPWRPGE